MKQTTIKKLLSFILCIVLIAAMALIASGCNANENNPADSGTGTTAQTDANTVTKLGAGQTVFNFTVVDKDGNETRFEIATDKTTVGEALLELNLIEGEAGAYGLYVKKVNGITADYDVDQTYWAFYVNGEYATGGVDTTTVTAGATYSFKVAK